MSVKTSLLEVLNVSVAARRMYQRQATNFLAWVPKTMMYFASVLKRVTNAAK
jgi:hypothetical protein